jgi:hypothetical protein
MTRLSKPVRRVSGALVPEQGKPRNIVVTLTPPNLISFRAAGRRRAFSLTVESCYTMAVKAEVEAARREKARARAKARAARRKD